MELRSHTKAMSEGEVNQDAVHDDQKERVASAAARKESEVCAVDRNSTVPSDRDFQEYMTSRLPFYCPDRAVEECKCPYETFTHQSFCILINANRMSVRRALKQEDERKRSASRAAIKAEIKQLMDVKAFQPVHLGGMSEQSRRKIIPSHMFLKKKSLAN
jgi:hypothetical protein